MARLTKATLISLIRAAVEGDGWLITSLSAAKEHPFRFEMANGTVRRRVRAYIWNVTHGGGKKRSPKEYRIQITKVRQFEPEPGGTTLILGWNQNFGAFAAFDITHHARPLGSSPSIQISSGTLQGAHRLGIATQAKGNQEVAIAVRPDYLAWYILNKDEAHRGNVSYLPEPADDKIDFLDLADPKREHHLGSAAERAQRPTVLDRIAVLEREVKAIKPQIAMMGHNHPPEAMECEPEVLGREISGAVATVRTELAKDRPDVAAVGRGARILQRIYKVLRGVRDEARDLAGAVKKKARDKAAELVITAIGGGTLYGPQIIDALQSTVTAINRWFQLLLG